MDLDAKLGRYRRVQTGRFLHGSYCVNNRKRLCKISQKSKTQKSFIKFQTQQASSFKKADSREQILLEKLNRFDREQEESKKDKVA